jgi:hypothetical protein
VVDVLAVRAQDAEQPAHLRERLAAGGLDGAERGHRRLGIAIEDAARRPGLDDHHRDRVGDDVVQFACDPHAFARHGVALALGALALELLGTGGQLRGQAGAAAHDPSQGPAGREEHDREDDVAHGLVLAERGDCEDQREHAGEATEGASALQVGADREGRHGEDDRRGGEVLGRRPGQPERDRRRSDRGEGRERGHAAPRQRRREDGPERQGRHERRVAHRRERQLELHDHAEHGRQRDVEAAGALGRHVAGSPTGRRARSSKPRGRRRSARSSPP